jgi:hypothetical protein
MYGHLKLSDSTNSTSDNTSGIAATPKAVKSAYDLANAALPKNIESSNNTKIYITGSSSTSSTSSLLVDSGVYISETPGELVATTFTGSLNGNALSATQDSSGNVIVDTYLTKEAFEEYKESGEFVGASEAIWTVTESIPENTIVDIPNGVVYPYNRNAIRVSVDGLILSKNVNYEEVPSAGMSSQIKFLFNVDVNSVIQVWVAPQSEIKGSLDFIQSSVEITNENVEQCRQYVQNAGIIDNLEAILNSKASIESPTLTGTPTAPTATAGTNTTQIATTAFVTNAVNNKVSYDRVVIDRGNLLYSEYPLALLSIDINNVDYYKVLAPYGVSEFVVGLFDRPVTTEEEFMYRFFGGAAEPSQVEAQDTTNTSDDVIVDSLGMPHPAPRILENGNHLKTIMIDIECTNIGYENAEPMLLDLDNSGNGTADAWGPGYEIEFIEWPPCVFWANNTLPEFSGNRCVFLLVSYDGGYTWIGMSSAINVPVYDYTESSEPEES